MRKLACLLCVASVAAIALGLIGCGKKAPEEGATTAAGDTGAGIGGGAPKQGPSVGTPSNPK